MILALFLWLFGHISHGPLGWTAWVQPPHFYAGISYVQGTFEFAAQAQ
jgi:hypothetical protein